MIRLAVFDIDRTLIDPEVGVIASETVEAIRYLQRNGMVTVIASGRQWQLLHNDLKEMNFDYYILSNGSCIVDGHGNILHIEAIDEATVSALTEDIVQLNLPMEMRYAEGVYTGNPANRIHDYLQNTDYLKNFEEEFRKQQALAQKPDGQPMSFVTVIPDTHWLYFTKKYPQLDFLPINGCALCDVNKSGISKAAGLQKICDLTGISISETIAFGDDRNDLELIRDAGVGVAMADSIPEVLIAANYITDTCASLGVVKGLRQFGLLP